MRDRKPLNTRCGECGMDVGHAAAYHPFLFCELFKLGHRDPAAYLAQYGFVRVGAREGAQR